jgi:hypothetical protein
MMWYGKLTTLDVTSGGRDMDQINLFVDWGVL